jgi:hypothetical protein
MQAMYPYRFLKLSKEATLKRLKSRMNRLKLLLWLPQTPQDKITWWLPKLRLI